MCAVLALYLAELAHLGDLALRLTAGFARSTALVGDLGGCFFSSSLPTCPASESSAGARACLATDLPLWARRVMPRQVPGATGLNLFLFFAASCRLAQPRVATR